MSVNGDFDYLLPPSRRRTATNGSTAGGDKDKLVPLLESYSSLTSSMTSTSDTIYAPEFSYISTVCMFEEAARLLSFAASRFQNKGMVFAYTC